MKNPEEIVAFGLHLRKLREERGYSQQELADICNIAKTSIQRMELAKYVVSLDVLVSISKGLQIPVAELVSFKI